MRYRFINYCVKCYFGVMRVSRSSYFMLSHGHPVVIPDIHTLTCDICGHVDMNDDRYYNFIDLRKGEGPEPRRKKHTEEFENQLDKKQK